jgi:tetratricopeptide (TPR) repeat protein
LVIVAAVILVVGIALLVGRLTGDATKVEEILQGPLVSAVTGTTDRLTEEEMRSGPTVASATGRLQPSEQEWAALLPRLQELAEADPDDVNVQRKLALAYYNLGRLDEALDVYERLLAAEEDAVLRNRLGNTLRDMGDEQGAEAAYRKAIAEDPTLGPPYLNLAELLWRQGRDEEALGVIDAGLAAVAEEDRPRLETGRGVIEGATRQ